MIGQHSSYQTGARTFAIIPEPERLPEASWSQSPAPWPISTNYFVSPGLSSADASLLVTPTDL